MIVRVIAYAIISDHLTKFKGDVTLGTEASVSNLAIRLVILIAFLLVTKEPDFSRACGFRRILTTIMVHYLNPHQWTEFSVTPKNQFFFGYLWALSTKLFFRLQQFSP